MLLFLAYLFYYLFSLQLKNQRTNSSTLFTVESSLLNTYPQTANFKLSFLWEVVCPNIYQLLLQALLSEDIRFEVMNCILLEDCFTEQSFMELIWQSSGCEQVTIWAKRIESSVLARNLPDYNSNSAFTG